MFVTEADALCYIDTHSIEAKQEEEQNPANETTAVKAVNGINAVTKIDGKSTDSVEKPKQLTEFTLLPDLPPELRRRIWRNTVTPWAKGDALETFNHGKDILSILMTSHEARDEILAVITIPSADIVNTFREFRKNNGPRTIKTGPTPANIPFVFPAVHVKARQRIKTSQSLYQLKKNGTGIWYYQVDPTAGMKEVFKGLLPPLPINEHGIYSVGFGVREEDLPEVDSEDDNLEKDNSEDNIIRPAVEVGGPRWYPVRLYSGL